MYVQAAGVYNRMTATSQNCRYLGDIVLEAVFWNIFVWLVTDVFCGGLSSAVSQLGWGVSRLWRVWRFPFYSFLYHLKFQAGSSNGKSERMSFNLLGEKVVLNVPSKYKLSSKYCQWERMLQSMSSCYIVSWTYKSFTSIMYVVTVAVVSSFHHQTL